jgi:hypothetical protein
MLNVSLAAFGASIAGGFVGGGLTYLGVIKSLRSDSEKSRSATNENVNAFCKSIAAELEAVVERQRNNLGPLFEQITERHFINGYQIADQNYFIVFDNNATMVGRMRDQELGRKIIKLYIKMKGHLDTFKVHAQLFSELKSLKDESAQQPHFDMLKISEKEKEMVEQTQVLKSEYVEIESLSKEMIHSLQAYDNGLHG